MTQDLHQKIESIINRNLQADDREVMFQLKQLLYEKDLHNDAGKAAKNIADLVVENLNQLESEAYQAAIIKTGFDDFDTQFGGFRLGEFVVVGGRPAMGKTQLLVNLSLNMSLRVPVLYITLDLSEFSLTNRFIESTSGIPAGNILQNNLNYEQKNKLSKIGGIFRKRRLFIHDSCNTSITALKAYCKEQVQENGIQVIIVDSLHLLSSHDHRKYRELEVSYICRELKNTAKENNICLIASSQLNRAVEYRTSWHGHYPQLSDLKDSGSIEQEADKVIFVHRPEYYKIYHDENGNDLSGVVEIIMAKNRNGPQGEILLYRDSDYINFRSNNDKFLFSSSRLKEIDYELGNTPF